MRAALERELGGAATWTAPDGGLFLWVTLADGYDATRLLAAAFEQKVAYIPGAHFSAQGGGANTLRLNYSNNTPERIAEGVRRLGVVVREGSVAGDEAAMPAQQCRRGDQERRPSLARQELGEEGEQGPVGGGVARPGDLALPHAQPVAQHGNLDVLVVRRRSEPE